jgi:two-component system, NarL family, sensor histidine kinase UhpB
MCPAAVEPLQRVRRDRRVRRTPTAALFWRLFLLNALLFCVAAALLALSPATVSTPVALRELSVMGAGLVLALAVNALLIRASLRPLNGLAALMSRMDLLQPGERLTVPGHGNLSDIVRTFNDMLDRLETEGSTSSALALAAQEGERQRIARELHDEIGQSLTAVLLGLKRAVDRAPDDLRAELYTIQEMTRDTIDEVRQVARRLRPGVLQDLGLTSAMSALAADFTDATRRPVNRHIDPRLPNLTSEQELVVYRVAQEGLTNVARHAGASRVELSLTGENGGVMLRIVDDGRGRGGAREGAGIRGMRERALLVGGNLTLEPADNGGTEVRLYLPVPAGRA